MTSQHSPEAQDWDRYFADNIPQLWTSTQRSAKPTARARVFRRLNLWLRVQDNIGPKEEWPTSVLESLWCSDYHYRARMILTAFAYGSGLHIALLLEMFELISQETLSIKKIRKFRAIWNYFESGPDIRNRYTHYNLYRKQVMTLNFKRS